jgi:preprotein translocase subunit SecE
MSRIQKKKPAAEKKKKKTDIEASPSGDVSDAKPRQAAVSAPQKIKTEKKQFEAVKEATPGKIQNGVEFLREVKVELKKVTWPTRKQTTGTTIVVIIFVFILAVFLGLFDYSLSKLVQVVLT